ncbi:DUF6527 family protein [Flammeovirga sp. EKP202]|uniref:DUF6527 family protein n=1 Tax=Flammeovirga sp. EKP202 TaxID=2770592 RepID=UPI00165F59CE|nr:DUF6527 family protein [Flammeovirga sp. EKP202]MBD0403237.1 hypothetical protein [Flammeovirga sp. EKP202]
MRKVKLKFVEEIPEVLNENILYISMEYATATHLCMCGCGNKVVTPISSKGWLLSYDGDGITLSPSIGNWNFKCKSHYYIRDSSILWLKDDMRNIKMYKKDNQIFKFLKNIKLW